MMNLSDLKNSSLGLIGGFEYTSSGSYHANYKPSSKADFNPEVEQRIFTNTFGDKSVHIIFDTNTTTNEQKNRNTKRNIQSKKTKRKTSKKL
jgi:hypothetical protein